MVITVDLDRITTANSHSNNNKPKREGYESSSEQKSIINNEIAVTITDEKVARGTEITASEPDEESLTHNNVNVSDKV